MSNAQNALLANHQSAVENKVISKLPATTRVNHGWIGVRIDLVVILPPPYHALIVRGARKVSLVPTAGYLIARISNQLSHSTVN